MSGELRLVHRQERGVHTGHLAGADADRHPVPREHDRVRLDAADGAPREEQVAQLLVGRLPLGQDASSRRVDDRGGALLHQDAAAHALVVEAPAGHCARPSSTRRFFLRPSDLERVGANCGATMHSTKSLETTSAVSSSTGLLNAITEPNAETGSHASAFLYASSASVPARGRTASCASRSRRRPRRRTARSRAARPRDRAGC